MEHDFSKVFDTDNPMWQEVLAIFTTNEQHPKKPTIGRAIHHKFPRSISKALGERVDGSKANLISLTHKDHFMIHYYYFKLALPSYRGAMASAFRFMVNKGDVKINDMETKLAKEISDTYQVAMTEFSKRHSALMKGKKKSKEHCQHISEGRKGIVFSEEHKQHLKEASHRRVLTPEQRDRMRTGLGKHPKFSEEHMRKWHEARHNTPTSEETRRKMSESAKRRYQLHPMSDEERQRRSQCADHSSMEHDRGS